MANVTKNVNRIIPGSRAVDGLNWTIKGEEADNLGKNLTVGSLALDHLRTPNLSLLAGRFLPTAEKDDDGHPKFFPSAVGGAKVKNIDDLKRLRLMFLSDRGNRGFTSLAPIWKGLHQRRERMDPQAAFRMTTATRLLVGHGNATLLEVGLTIDPLYGFPYIPGASLKGLTRAWLRENAEFLSKWLESQKALRGKGVPGDLDRWLFGNPAPKEHGQDTGADEGALVFCDAWPVDPGGWYDIDILNPHYGPYYMDGNHKEPPADYHSPNPVFFLCVAKNVPFEFIVGVSRAARHLRVKDGRDEKLVNTPRAVIDAAISLGCLALSAALQTTGVGGKRAADYGYFQKG